MDATSGQPSWQSRERSREYSTESFRLASRSLLQLFWTGAQFCALQIRFHQISPVRSLFLCPGLRNSLGSPKQYIADAFYLCSYSVSLCTFSPGLKTLFLYSIDALLGRHPAPMASIVEFGILSQCRRHLESLSSQFPVQGDPARISCAKAFTSVSAVQRSNYLQGATRDLCGQTSNSVLETPKGTRSTSVFRANT